MAMNLGEIQIDPHTGRATIAPKTMGLDPGKAAKEIVEAKLTQQTRLPEASIKNIDKQTEALSKFESLIKDYTQALSALKGRAETGENKGDLAGFVPTATSTLTPALAPSGGARVATTPTDLIDFNIENCMDPLAFDLQVNRIAQKDFMRGYTGFSSSTETLEEMGLMTNGQTEEITFNEDNSQKVIISSDMSITDIVKVINDQQAITGVRAQSIAVTPTDYRLYFQSTQTGTPLNFSYSGGLQALSQMPYDNSHILSLEAVIDKNNALEVTGNIYLGIGGGPHASAATINVQNNDSLDDIRQLINNQTGSTGIIATIQTEEGVGSRLVLSTQDGTKPKISSDPNLQIAQLPVSMAMRQTFLSAQIVYQDTSIIRPSNQITDLIPNANLTLKKADPYTTISVSMKPPVETVFSDIQNWIEKHNTMLDFITEQTAFISEKMETLEKPPLRDSLTMQAVQSFLNQDLNSIVAGASSANTLVSLGIDIKEKGYLSINQNLDPVTKKIKILSMIEDNFPQVQEILAFNCTSSNADFILGKRPNILPDQVAKAGIIVQVSKDVDGNLSGSFTVPGPSGFTAMAQLVNTGNYADISVDPTDPNAQLLGELSFTFFDVQGLNAGETASSTFLLSQGVADRLMKDFSGVLYEGKFDEVTKRVINQGALILEKETLQENKKQEEKKINDIKEKMQDYKELLIQRFTKMSAKVTKVLNFQEQLKSLMKSSEAA